MSDDLQVGAVRTIIAEVRRTGSARKILCPAHDDHNPSLSIWLKTDGRVGIKCHAGCNKTEVLKKLAVTKNDLGRAGRGASDESRTGATVQPHFTLRHYAEAKHLPITFLKG